MITYITLHSVPAGYTPRTLRKDWEGIQFPVHAFEFARPRRRRFGELRKLRYWIVRCEDVIAAFQAAGKTSTAEALNRHLKLRGLKDGLKIPPHYGKPALMSVLEITRVPAAFAHVSSGKAWVGVQIPLAGDLEINCHPDDVVRLGKQNERGYIVLRTKAVEALRAAGREQAALYCGYMITALLRFNREDCKLLP